MNAYERLIDALRDHGSIVLERGDKAQAQCPAHDDGKPSLSIGSRRDGKGVVAKCHAGCELSDVLAALDLALSDLFDDPKVRDIYAPRRDYTYPGGRKVHRKPGKDFPQSGNKADRSLFGADKITDDTRTVLVVEGEKDVEAAQAAGVVAVCSAMGAGKAHLADWSVLAGKAVIIVADKDNGGRAHAHNILVLLDGIAASATIVEAKTGKDFADHFAAGLSLDELIPVLHRAPSERLTLIRLADVIPERVSWLWPGRIPVGKLVTLDGDPGLGKSTLALDISATVTTGGRWPDGTACDYPGAVLLMSAEDGLADTVRPRLDVAGADVTKVHAITGVPVDDEGTLRPPTLADVAGIEDAITATGARLLVIDVVMAYLPTGTDAHKDQDIRRVLSRLSALADRTGCTVLLLRHLNKAKGGDPLYRGGGSIGIVGAARAGLLVATEPDDTGLHVLASVKSNLGPTPESLTYRLADAGDMGVARVQWEGRSDRTARSLLAERAGDDDGAAASEAEQWLEDYLLQQGSAQSKTVKLAAAKVGIAERTIERAAKKLGVVVESKGFPRVTWWSLPHHSRANTPTDTPVSQNLGATGATGDDLHKRVGATGPNSQSRQPVETGATVTRAGGNDAYRTGLCNRCGEHRHRPGSTMCDPCFQRWQRGEIA